MRVAVNLLDGVYGRSGIRLFACYWALSLPLSTSCDSQSLPPSFFSTVRQVLSLHWTNGELVVASVSLMVCLGVSIAGLIHTTRDISQFSWSHSECDDITYSRSPPTYEDRNNDHLSTCKRVLTNYKKMQFGLLIMSLLIMIWGICSSAMFLGYRLYLVFTASKCEKPQEEDDDEPLLSPNP